MEEALIAVGIVFAGAVIGALFTPTEEQKRPLVPEKPTGAEAEAAHHHHH